MTALGVSDHYESPLSSAQVDVTQDGALRAVSSLSCAVGFDPCQMANSLGRINTTRKPRSVALSRPNQSDLLPQRTASSCLAPYAEVRSSR